MKHRLFDDEFKKMAVELSRHKNSVKEAVTELDLDPSRLSGETIQLSMEAR